MAGSTPASVTASDARQPDALEALRLIQEGSQVLLAPELGKAITSVSPWQEAWRRFKRHRLAYWSLWVLGFMVLAVIFGPMLYKVGINDVDLKARRIRVDWQADY